MVLILELPRYYLGPKGINKLPLISHWGQTGQKNKLQGNHRRKTKQSYSKLKKIIIIKE